MIEKNWEFQEEAKSKEDETETEADSVSEGDAIESIRADRKLWKGLCERTSERSPFDWLFERFFSLEDWTAMLRFSYPSGWHWLSLIEFAPTFLCFHGSSSQHCIYPAICVEHIMSRTGSKRLVGVAYSPVCNPFSDSYTYIRYEWCLNQESGMLKITDLGIRQFFVFFRLFHPISFAHLPRSLFIRLVKWTKTRKLDIQTVRSPTDLRRYSDHRDNWQTCFRFIFIPPQPLKSPRS